MVLSSVLKKQRDSPKWCVCPLPRRQRWNLLVDQVDDFAVAPTENFEWGSNQGPTLSMSAATMHNFYDMVPH